MVPIRPLSRDDDSLSTPVTVTGDDAHEQRARRSPSRDAFNGAILVSLTGTITDNEITNGPHGGVVMGGQSIRNLRQQHSVEDTLHECVRHYRFRQQPYLWQHDKSGDW